MITELYYHINLKPLLVKNLNETFIAFYQFIFLINSFYWMFQEEKN